VIQKPDIQYIESFFVPGAEAPQPQPRWGAKPAASPVPQPKQEPKIRILVDPVATIGLVVTAVMLVLMIVGIFQFTAASQERDEMAAYLIQLQDENLTKRHDYHTKRDLDWIREQALALGMIPIEEATTISVKITVPQPEPEPTLWENILWFFEGLFA